jgi:hypothetical protein
MLGGADCGSHQGGKLEWAHEAEPVAPVNTPEIARW